MFVVQLSFPIQMLLEVFWSFCFYIPLELSLDQVRIWSSWRAPIEELTECEVKGAKGDGDRHI